MIRATILVNKEHVGTIMELCQEKRGTQLEFTYLGETRVVLTYLLPLNEVVVDFYDQLKSLTSGYTSLDYEEAGYQESKLVKMDVLLNGSSVDALASIAHIDKAQYIGRMLVEKLKEIIDRQLYEISIQAVIGVKVIARATISGFRKDVISHCYGGVGRTRGVAADAERTRYVQTTRILREAVSNVLKHSGASYCQISIRQDHNDFELTIADNGKGIPMEMDGKVDRGHGMSTMKGRAQQLQGQCLVESGPGYGTTIRLTLPL